MPTERFSLADYNGTGDNRLFAVPFPYISREHVYLLVNDTPVAFSWINNSLIEAAAPPAIGSANVRVQRITPAEEMLTVFSSPSTFQSNEVNGAFRQLLYIVQEAFDAAIEALELSREVRAILGEVLEKYDEIIMIYDAMLALYEDMTQLYNEIMSVWLNATWDVTISVPYRTARSEVVGSFQYDEEMTVIANAAGSRAWTLTPIVEPEEAAVIGLFRRPIGSGTDTQFATVTFAPGSRSGTFSSFPQQVFNPGDTLVIKRQPDGGDTLNQWGLCIRTRRFPTGDIT